MTVLYKSIRAKWHVLSNFYYQISSRIPYGRKVTMAEFYFWKSIIGIYNFLYDLGIWKAFSKRRFHYLIFNEHGQVTGITQRTSREKYMPLILFLTAIALAIVFFVRAR